MIDEVLYSKHQNAITTSQHTEISVEYAIGVLENLRLSYDDRDNYEQVNNFIRGEIRALKALLK